jgi:hypothetical protein
MPDPVLEWQLASCFDLIDFSCTIVSRVRSDSALLIVFVFLPLAQTPFVRMPDPIKSNGDGSEF